MPHEEAVDWLHAVDGQLYKSSIGGAGKPESWVAVVTTPRAGSANAKLIIALGETITDATSAAADQWHQEWDKLSGGPH